jgi:hypothetical protein
MVQNQKNRIFKGYCENTGNERSNILLYDILTVRDIYDYDREIIPETVDTPEEYFNLDNLGVDEPYYAVYATFRSDNKSIKIFESNELRSVIFVVEQLTGNEVIENEIQC